MTTRIYTAAHADWLLNEGFFDTESTRVNASLVEAFLRRSYPNILDLSIGQYITHYLKLNWKKLRVLDDVLKFLMANNCRRILSVGSGEAVLEYMLKEYAKIEKYDLDVFASDLSDLHVLTSKNFFHELEFYKFDFTNNPVSQILDQCGKVDAILSFGSFYVMNDNELSSFLNDAAEASIRYVIDFHAGCIVDKGEYLNAVKHSKMVKDGIEKLHEENPNTVVSSGVVFHGYARMPHQILSVYNNSGWTVSEIFNISEIDAYKFTVAFERKIKD